MGSEARNWNPVNSTTHEEKRERMSLPSTPISGILRSHKGAYAVGGSIPSRCDPPYYHPLHSTKITKGNEMKNTMYACISVLALALAIFLVVATFEAKKISTEMTNYIVDAREQQKQLHEQQKQLREEAETVSTILGNIITYGITVSLQEEGLISPTDANRITTNAMDAISNESEAYGTLIKAVNDKIIKESR